MMKKRGLWEIVILTLIIGLGIQIAPDIASACGSCGVPEGCGSRGVSDEGCGSCGVVAPAKKEIKESSSSKVNTIEEIKGELTCIGCELKSHEGARAQCKVYGHKYGFKLKDGSLWSFIENDRSKLLISNKVPGKNIIKVTIYGRKFPKVHYIDVDHFKVCEKGPKEKVICKEYVWCIVFKRMEKAWGKVSYEGKTYNVCCPGCKKSFNKNPKKYVHEEAPSEKHEPKKHEHE